MDRETAEALLRPWTGEAVLADLPLPYLVTVRLDREAPASALTLGRALAEAGLDATVDDHSLWRGEVERSAMLISLLALAAFLTTAFAAGAADHLRRPCGPARRAGSVIETLSLSGATDASIVRLFQRRFALLALISGSGRIGDRNRPPRPPAGPRRIGRGPIPALPVAWVDILMLSPCPLVAATVALVAAQLGAGREMARLGASQVGG